MPSLPRRALLYSFFTGAACLLGRVASTAGESTNCGPPDGAPEPRAAYHADREHLWNRVHDAFYTRTGPDGLAYGTDRLEPLLWSASERLLKGPSADRAVAVLEEFERAKGETLVDDPLKRAVLQRDLWLVFNWLTRDEADPARERLGRRLAAVIRRLALTPEQVAELPDNYAAAVASKRFSGHFDPGRPERPYLPPDLFAADGPWACVGRTDGPAAPMHLQESGTNRFTNSVFLVFVKLPGGRAASLDFVGRVRAVAQPMLPAVVDESGRRGPPAQNPGLPPLPKGTELALVRRALLVDASRRVVVSPLTESVQVRVLRVDAPAPAAGQAVSGMLSAEARKVEGRQAFFEFQFRRADLFAGGAGGGRVASGLRDVSAERDFKTGFNAHRWDEFERTSDGPFSPGDRPFPDRARPAASNRASCVTCHGSPTTYAFQSAIAVLFDEDGKPPPNTLAAMTVREVEQAAVRWKQGRPGWAALRALMPE